MKLPLQYCTSNYQPGDDGGIFEIPFEGRTLFVIGGVGLEWDHVSVSLKNRCPNWREMCFVKDMFWNEDEVVMQLHVAMKDHINMHPHCLHLWKPQNQTIPLPPGIMVGF